MVCLRALLVDAFREHYADLAVTTRHVAWLALRRFARFVAQDGLIGSAGDLDSSAVRRYVLWLRAAECSEGRPAAPRSTGATAFDVLRPLLYCASAIGQGCSRPILIFPTTHFLPSARARNRGVAFPRTSSRPSSVPAMRRSTRSGAGFNTGRRSSGCPTCRCGASTVRASLAGPGGSAASKAESCQITPLSNDTASRSIRYARTGAAIAPSPSIFTSRSIAWFHSSLQSRCRLPPTPIRCD